MRVRTMTMAILAAATLAGCGMGGDLGTDPDSSANGLTGTGDTPTAVNGCAATCDDGNPCTIDTCNIAGCQHTPLDDGAVACADEVSVLSCDNGTPRNLSCAEACLANGYNAYAACDDTDAGCPCGFVTNTCTPGATACVGYSRYVASCESAADAGTSENVWRAYDCDDICRDAGYGPAVSCGIDLNDFTQSACYCQELCNPDCGDGYSCYDGSCYPTSTTPAPGTSTECGADWECGYKEACEGGFCVQVECKIDSDCGWCEQCNQNYCDSCTINQDGSCGCY